MGAEQSNTYPNPPKMCGLSNDHIAYITKQYLTILKANDILTDLQPEIFNNNELSEPHKYMIDVKFIFQDLISNKPLQTTLDIFKPTRKLTGYSNGQPIYNSITSLDEYNNYFLNEYSNLATKTLKIERAKEISKLLKDSSDLAIKVLKDSCVNTGKLVGQMQYPTPAVSDETIVKETQRVINTHSKIDYDNLLNFVKQNRPDLYDVVKNKLDKNA